MYKSFLQWLGSYLTPNQITIIRAFFIIPAAYLWQTEILMNEISAVIIMVISWYGDHLDGAVARACGLETVTGKWLDPLVDKIVIYTTILVFWGQVDKITLLIIFMLDLVSTFTRTKQEGAVQGANWFGKRKLVSQVTVTLIFALAKILQFNIFVDLANFLLIVSIILASISVSLRLGIIDKMKVQLNCLVG